MTAKITRAEIDNGLVAKHATGIATGNRMPGFTDGRVRGKNESSIVDFETSRQAGFPTITPASGVADGFRIPQFTSRLRQDRQYPNGETREIGQIVDQVEHRLTNGQQTIFRTTTATSDDEADWRQEIEVDRATLAPHHVAIHNGDKLLNRVIYDDHILHVTRQIWPEGYDSHDPVTAGMTLTPPVRLFEWQLWELTIAALPLQPGFTCQFLAHHVADSSASPLIRIGVEVIGPETLQSETEGAIDCWRVAVTADTSWTVWVARDKNAAPIARTQIHYPEFTDQWTRVKVGGPNG